MQGIPELGRGDRTEQGRGEQEKVDRGWRRAEAEDHECIPQGNRQACGACSGGGWASEQASGQHPLAGGSTPLYSVRGEKSWWRSCQGKVPGTPIFLQLPGPLSSWEAPRGRVVGCFLVFSSLCCHPPPPTPDGWPRLSHTNGFFSTHRALRTNEAANK